MRPTILLAALLCFCQSSLAQNPPTNPPTPNTPPTRRSRETARVVGKIFPGYGATRLPSLMTITLVSVNRGYMKVSMVQGASFEFSQVPPGRYTLRLESVGFESAEKEIDVQPLGTGSTEFVSMILGAPESRSDDVQPTDSGAVVTASSLGVPQKAFREMEKSAEASARGDSRKAVQHLEKALKIHPDFPEAYNNLAVQYSKLGREEDAVEALEKSIELHPTAQAYLNLGILHYRRGRGRQAVSALCHSSRLDSKSLPPVRALAEIYFDMGQYVLALKRYWEWNQLNPNAEAVIGMGHCYRRLGMFEEARKELRDFLESSPDSDRIERVRQLLADLDGSGRQ